ncbi:hypothetical protein F4801DRAFT_580657 [Xylaria longipes]|nr:hypothetical protein F4801DRAFT_580657 [Xylaria longipes]
MDLQSLVAQKNRSEAILGAVQYAIEWLHNVKAMPHLEWFKAGSIVKPPAMLPVEQICGITFCVDLIKKHITLQNTYESVEHMITCLEISIGFKALGDLIFTLQSIAESISATIDSLNEIFNAGTPSNCNNTPRTQVTAEQATTNSSVVSNAAPHNPSPLGQITGVNNSNTWEEATGFENVTWENCIQWEVDAEPSEG